MYDLEHLKTVIEHLKSVYPFNPSLKTTHRELDHMMGQQSVIRHLEAHYNDLKAGSLL